MKDLTIAVATTALNILDGIDHRVHWDVLQPAWESQSFGFDGFCGWIAEIAVESESMLEEHTPQDFPGVYDYEVSYELGVLILQHVISTHELPHTSTWKYMLTTLFVDFFEQGLKDDDLHD